MSATGLGRGKNIGTRVRARPGIYRLARLADHLHARFTLYDTILLDDAGYDRFRLCRVREEFRQRIGEHVVPISRYRDED